MQRLQVHRKKTSSQGDFANDDDASFFEQVAVVYDVCRAQFREPVALGLYNLDVYDLLPGSDAGHFEILVSNDSGIELSEWDTDAPSDTNGKTLGHITFGPEGKRWLASKPIWDAAHDRHLLILGGGEVIEIRHGLKRIGKVAGLGSSRTMYTPTVSEDGKLLVVPTGPYRNWSPLLPAFYIDQVDFYDVTTLKPLRSLHSQRPFLQIQPNYDGSLLLALPAGGKVIDVLNSATLWQDREYTLEIPLETFAVFPTVP